MRRPLAVAFLALAPLAVRAVDAGVVPSDEEGFTSFVAERMRQTVRDAPVSVKGPLALAVGTMEVNLGRVYAFCRREPDACARELDAYVGGVSESLRQRNAPVQKAAVRLLVRETGYAKRAQQTFGAGAPVLLVEPFAGGFTVMIAADTPRTIRFLDERALAELGLNRAAVFELARANVRAELQPLAAVAEPVKRGEIGTIRGSVHEVSRVALHEDWAALAKAQGGKLVVAMPATDVVLYASEDTTLAVEALRMIARHAMEVVANPLSTEILAWTPEGWSRVR